MCEGKSMVDLTKIDAALENPEASVTEGDASVTYRSPEELQQAREILQGNDSKAALRGKRRMRFFSFNSGLFK